MKSCKSLPGDGSTSLELASEKDDSTTEPSQRMATLQTCLHESPNSSLWTLEHES